jgi:glycine/D-amino acid oxidase-like deaminating enzyme
VEREAEVVIIGGGIVGAAAAYYLAKRGVRALLVENGEIGGQQSGRNWGFVRQQGRHPLEVPLMVESNRIWQGLEKELAADIEWVQGGNLALAADGERLALFEGWLTVAREHGMDTRLLSGDEVAELIPRMRARWAGGLYTPGDGHAEPAKVSQAFARAARELGANIHTRCAVERVVVNNGRVTGVVTDQGAIDTKRVVCAAGAWSAKLARQVGLNLPQRWVRGTVARTTPAPPVTPAGVWGPKVAFRQRKDGAFNIAAGGTTDYDVTLDTFRNARIFLPNYWTNRKLFEFHVGKPLLRDLQGVLPRSEARRHPFGSDREIPIPPNPARVKRALAEFIALFPSLKGLRVERAWAGYIDATPDAIPVPAEVAQPKGFIFATGFSGHGFAMGPVAGRIVSEIIVDGDSPLPIEGFRYSRFKEGKMAEPRSVL